ncbi:MAG: ATP synthase F1 subunit gamma [Patescibacteria group bacterium]
MAGSRAIKNRIKSTKNIQQITKAMEAVSAVKMRRSEGAAIKGRPYALYALDILRKIEKSTGEDIRSLSPLFEKRANGKNAIVVISSDKGLAGAFNANVTRKSAELLATMPNSDIIAVGKKGRDFFTRKGENVVKSFEQAGDFVSLSEAKHISEFVLSLFIDKKYDRIDIVYTNFVSALKQEAVHRPLLPLNNETLNSVVNNIIPATGKFADLKSTENLDNKEYKFEPSPATIVKNLVPTLVELEIFHSILEANASEHAARMMAMKNASESAKDVIGALTIKYNKERQAQITKELIEITSGKEALEAQLAA